MTPEGLIIVASHHGPKETADRLATAIAAHGMQVMARIDHQQGAEAAGLEMKAAQVLIFGNARAGTQLMQGAPTLALDLPLKALVFEDAQGHTCVAYNDPHWLGARHGAAGPQIEAMTSALASVIAEACA